MSGDSTSTEQETAEQESGRQESEETANAAVTGERGDTPGTSREGSGDTESADELEQLRLQVEQHKQVIADSRDKLARAQAELENMRKRTARDVENAHKYALEKFISDLLPVMDSMELGISAADSAGDMASVREGMELTMKKFGATLEKFGVREINPQNEKFNPELHEAVTMQEQDGARSGTVISVMQKGYELNGRLVRPAMVIVAK